MKQTAVDWYWDKIKSHFEHDGDLLETATFTFAIAKQKEREQIEDAYDQDLYGGLSKNRIFDNGKQYYDETYGGEQ
jgi:hypothetical protein